MDSDKIPNYFGLIVIVVTLILMLLFSKPIKLYGDTIINNPGMAVLFL